MKDPISLLLAVTGVLGWISVFVTPMIEIFTDESQSIITAGKLSLYIAFTATILLTIYMLILLRKQKPN
jgi:hypothetical protein